MKVFVSYSRDSEPISRSVVADLEALGHEVWIDRELSGGQAWWEQILAAIRDCELMVFLLHPQSLSSVACTRERAYAAALGKPIVPLQVADGVSVNLLPPELAQRQIIPYRSGDRAELAALARAVSKAPPAPPLPQPLPEPPEVPASYLGALALRIDAAGAMSYEEQSALLIDLRQALREEDARADGEVLLGRLQKRRDLFATIAREIDALREPIVVPAAVPTPMPRPAAPQAAGASTGRAWRVAVACAAAGLALGVWALLSMSSRREFNAFDDRSLFLLYWPTLAGLLGGRLAAADGRAAGLALAFAVVGSLAWLMTGEPEKFATIVALGIAPGVVLGATLGWFLRRRTH